MELKIASLADVPGILRLQDKYLYAHLTENERLKGFVTTPFSVVQIHEVIANQGLFIALHNDEVIAYVFTGTWDFFASWPIFPHMLSTLVGDVFESTTIASANTFQYGPICIDEAYRGTELFVHLFEFMRVHMKSKFAVGLTFINKVNTHSYHAHTRKLGLEVIGEFSFNGNDYYSLAIDMCETVL